MALLPQASLTPLPERLPTLLPWLYDLLSCPRRSGLTVLKATLPCAILSTAVHIGSMFQQNVQDINPASCAGFMQGSVASIITVVHITALLLEAV